MRTGKVIAVAIGMLLLLSSCGSGSTGPQVSVFASEFVLSAVDDDLAQSVVVDSVSWTPTAFDFSASGELEVVGPFEIHFRSVEHQTLEMNYDLRFLDRDGFLFDRFIPFGLPVVFQPEQAMVESGEFEIRSAQMRLDDVRTMRIVATVKAGAGQ